MFSAKSILVLNQIKFQIKSTNKNLKQKKITTFILSVLINLICSHSILDCPESLRWFLRIIKVSVHIY